MERLRDTLSLFTYPFLQVKDAFQGKFYSGPQITPKLGEILPSELERIGLPTNLVKGVYAHWYHTDHHKSVDNDGRYSIHLRCGPEYEEGYNWRRAVRTLRSQLKQIKNEVSSNSPTISHNG